MLQLYRRLTGCRTPNFKNLRRILENLVVTKLLGDSLRCTYANLFGGARSVCTVVPNHYGGTRNRCTAAPGQESFILSYLPSTESGERAESQKRDPFKVLVEAGLRQRRKVHH